MPAQKPDVDKTSSVYQTSGSTESFDDTVYSKADDTTYDELHGKSKQKITVSQDEDHYQHSKYPNTIDSKEYDVLHRKDNSRTTYNGEPEYQFHHASLGNNRDNEYDSSISNFNSENIDNEYSKICIQDGIYDK